MIITIFQSTAYYQLYNVNPIWIQEHVGSTLPASSPGSLVLGAQFAGQHRGRAAGLMDLGAPGKRRREPDDFAKIATGAWISVASNLILVAGNFRFGRGAGSPDLAIPL